MGRCPACGAKLVVEIQVWELNEDGTRVPDEITVDCSERPDSDDSKHTIERWERKHEQSIYDLFEEQFTLTDKVLAWLKTCEFVDGEKERRLWAEWCRVRQQVP